MECFEDDRAGCAERNNRKASLVKKPRRKTNEVYICKHTNDARIEGYFARNGRC